MHRWIDFSKCYVWVNYKSLGNQLTCAALSPLGLDGILAETDSPFSRRQRVLGIYLRLLSTLGPGLGHKF